jgi:hypothetical protein
MKKSFTPGPWKVEKRTTEGEFITTTHILAENGDHLANVTPCNVEFNARLIAAAPSMLKVLMKIKQNHGPWRFEEGCDCDDCMFLSPIIAVIEEATGQTP